MATISKESSSFSELHLNILHKKKQQSTLAKADVTLHFTQNGSFRYNCDNSQKIKWTSKLCVCVVDFESKLSNNLKILIPNMSLTSTLAMSVEYATHIPVIGGVIEQNQEFEPINFSVTPQSKQKIITLIFDGGAEQFSLISNGFEDL